MQRSRVLIGILFAVVSLASLAAGQDLKPDEIIAKHLASIGKREARQGLKTLFITGMSEFQSVVPVVKGGGKAVIVSDPHDLYFLMSLNSKEYPFEKIGYFSDKMVLPFVSAGTRSPLGSFISNHSKLLDNGLFMGSMSMRWALLDVKGRNGKVASGGTKKIDGRKVYVLEYYPSDGASTEFTIKLSFDAETFQHVRTEYVHEIMAKDQVFGKLGLMEGVKQSLVEDFSNFKTVDGLTYPYTYKALYTTSSNSGTFQYIWGVRVAQYYLNQPLAPDFFTFDTSDKDHKYE